MSKIINIGTWVASFLFFFISILIILAQRSAPGNLTYGFKLGFEQALASFYYVLNKNTNNLQFEFTKNRFNEVQRVLASKNGPEGMFNLYAQIEQTQKTILNAQNSQEKSASAQQYIALLQQVSTQLTADKQLLQTNTPQPPPSPVTPQITPISSTSPIIQTSPTFNPIPSTVNQQPTFPQPTTPPSLAQQTTQQTPTLYQPLTVTPISQNTTLQQTSHTILPTSAPTAIPPVQPTSVPQTQTTTVAVTHSVTIAAIDQTQAKIQQTITELNKVTQQNKPEEKKEEKRLEPTEQKKNSERDKKDSKEGEDRKTFKTD